MSSVSTISNEVRLLPRCFSVMTSQHCQLSGEVMMSQINYFPFGDCKKETSYITRNNSHAKKNVRL